MIQFNLRRADCFIQACYNYAISSRVLVNFSLYKSGRWKFSVSCRTCGADTGWILQGSNIQGNYIKFMIYSDGHDIGYYYPYNMAIYENGLVEERNNNITFYGNAKHWMSFCRCNQLNYSGMNLMLTRLKD